MCPCTLIFLTSVCGRLDIFWNWLLYIFWNWFLFFFSFVCLQPICGNSYFLILGTAVNLVAPLQSCGKLGVHSTPGRSLPSGNMPKLMAKVRGVTLLSGKKCCIRCNGALWNSSSVPPCLPDVSVCLNTGCVWLTVCWLLLFWGQKAKSASWSHPSFSCGAAEQQLPRLWEVGCAQDTDAGDNGIMVTVNVIYASLIIRMNAPTGCPVLFSRMLDVWYN